MAKIGITRFSQVLPPDEFPLVDIPLDHELFHIVFDIKRGAASAGSGQFLGLANDWFDV